MIVKVAMRAHHDQNVVREVSLPDTFRGKGRTKVELLEAVFRCGQNDFQPVEGICSVSVGDVIVLDAELGFGRYHLITNTGFNRLTEQQHMAIGSMSVDERRLQMMELV